MTERTSFDRVCQTLVDQWQWDIAVMAEPWMYYPLLIPAGCFAGFMILKWILITAPLWVPFYMLFKKA